MRGAGRIKTYEWKSCRQQLLGHPIKRVRSACPDIDFETSRQLLINELADTARWIATRGGKVSRTRQRVGKQIWGIAIHGTNVQQTIVKCSSRRWGLEGSVLSGKKGGKDSRSSGCISHNVACAISHSCTGHPSMGICFNTPLTSRPTMAPMNRSYCNPSCSSEIS